MTIQHVRFEITNFDYEELFKGVKGAKLVELSIKVEFNHKFAKYNDIDVSQLTIFWYLTLFKEDKVVVKIVSENENIVVYDDISNMEEVLIEKIKSSYDKAIDAFAGKFLEIEVKYPMPTLDEESIYKFKEILCNRYR